MADSSRPQNFLADIIAADLAAGRNGGRVVTRFPPEPNGFLHIGHAKSILLNFGLARAFGGRTHLRFDDTNPVTEDTEYVEAILGDVRWLGGEWGEHLYYASDFFDRMYACAERLVREGKAYVDESSQEEIREGRGAFDRPGVNSRFRDRPPEESLDLLRRMKAGEFPDGHCVLRARIDMAHPNVLMRDPLLYRIRHAHHHRTGDGWCIYPMYDFAHPLEDAFEGVTHSICTLEFESNRELYDWVLDNLGPWDPRPHQYEFARLSLGYTVLSKRKLKQLVTEGRVAGWDDPRMPTLAGLRRRGVTPEALREFAELIGVAKNNSVVDIGKFEFAIRADLEARSPRALAVLDPLPVTVVDWPAGRVEELEIPWWPAEPEKGGRKVPFGRDLLIERDDFALDPPGGWKRLAPGREVRLAGAYVLRCQDVVRDEAGGVVSLRCTHDPRSLGGGGGGDRRRTGTLNWVHATRSAPAEVRLYDRLFTVEQPDAAPDFLEVLNPESLATAAGARVEPALAEAGPGTHWQFLRQGYFFVDPESRGAPAFNRTIALKDTWAQKQGARPDAGRPARSAEPPAPTPAPIAPIAPEPDEKARGGGRAAARAEARAADPVLADRFARATRELGLSAEEADLLTGDVATSGWFEAALQAYRGALTEDRQVPRSVARWLLNELWGSAPEGRLEALAITSAQFGAAVALVDAGRIAPPAFKALLASLVERPGDPAARLAELGLEKVEDRSALTAAVVRALGQHAAEVKRYRAGESKLLGFLLGAAMRATGGTAEAATVREILQAELARGEGS